MFFILSGATGFMLLDRRAFNRAVRAKHAAIPFLWLEQDSAGFAFIEKQASIGRHDFCFGMSTVWAGYRRVKNYGTH